MSIKELQRHPHGAIGRGADNDEDGYHQSQDESEEESGRPPGQRLLILTIGSVYFFCIRRYQFLIREVRGAALIDIHIIGARRACNGCWKERTKTQHVAWGVAWPSSALVEAVPGRTTPLATTRCGRPTGRTRGCCVSCRAPRPTRDHAALVAPVGDPMEDEGVRPLSASTTVPSTGSVSSSASRRRTWCVFFSFSFPAEARVSEAHPGHEEGREAGRLPVPGRIPGHRHHALCHRQIALQYGTDLQQNVSRKDAQAWQYQPPPQCQGIICHRYRRHTPTQACQCGSVPATWS
ncbi:uncharacterized protein LOC112262421 [Oncorhynchus tshawytscha]|uniref:uncharacterized protein LOC112262421 n=1 Tax=Oncorhynchus tshawytscha TaxID=74940 RepID=UPI001C3DC699|nr:uncharacterized protein LOC112262421 [Oncorhynchus tshawytscha]